MENILLNIKLDAVEFADCKVLDIIIDNNKKTFKIIMEEIYNISEKKIMENINFIGHGWENLKITAYNDINKQTNELNEYEKMEIISEIKIIKNKTIFCGFGKISGNWIEIIFDNLLYNIYQIK